MSVTPPTTLDAPVLDLVDRYWAGFLGCTPRALRRETAQVLVHAGLGSYPGCYVMEFGAAPVTSLPGEHVESYRQAVAQWCQGIVRTPARAQAVFGERVAASIGPAFVGYTDEKHFRPVTSSAARLLTAQDQRAVDALRDACSVQEWEHGGSVLRPGATTGVFRGRELAALAGYELWGAQIAHIAVVTRPAFRGHGCAATVVSALTGVVFERKLVPQYRTLEANAPSMAVARRLGFVEYATSLAIRFV